jgi:N-acetyl-anhydromuramyl-L-alanine amidase AmpD
MSGCSAGNVDDASTSMDALMSEGTTDTALTSTFLRPSSTAFQSGRPGVVRYIVIHDIEGSASSAINTFRAQGAQTSAHYVVDGAGGVVQMVHEADVANHAGHAAFNGYAVGIEHAGHTEHNEYTDAEYRGSAKLTADIAKRHGIPLDQDHIIGHSQVPTTNEVMTPCSRSSTTCGGRNQHADPGPFWDWTKYMALVNEAARTIGYSGVGLPDPHIVAAPGALLEITSDLPGSYWITHCDEHGLQTAFETTGGVSDVESRYVQDAVSGCGIARTGVLPLVLRGLAQADVHGLTLRACENGIARTYSVDGEVPCGGGRACAVASFVRASAAGACP